MASPPPNTAYGTAVIGAVVDSAATGHDQTVDVELTESQKERDVIAVLAGGDRRLDIGQVGARDEDVVAVSVAGNRDIGRTVAVDVAIDGHIPADPNS
jgi:hypothetical protein